MDRSNGYEAVAVEFLARRRSGRSTGIGEHEVLAWARTLRNGAAVIDLGCGPGFPITEVLVAEGLDVFALDAAPSFVQAFRQNLPHTPVACEAVQDSTFFGRTFDGVLAWGLMFLLSAEDQGACSNVSPRYWCRVDGYSLRRLRNQWCGTMR